MSVLKDEFIGRPAKDDNEVPPDLASSGKCIVQATCENLSGVYVPTTDQVSDASDIKDSEMQCGSATIGDVKLSKGFDVESIVNVLTIHVVDVQLCLRLPIMTLLVRLMLKIYLCLLLTMVLLGLMERILVWSHVMLKVHVRIRLSKDSKLGKKDKVCDKKGGKIEEVLTKFYFTQLSRLSLS